MRCVNLPKRAACCIRTRPNQAVNFGNLLALLEHEISAKMSYGAINFFGRRQSSLHSIVQPDQPAAKILAAVKSRDGIGRGFEAG